MLSTPQQVTVQPLTMSFQFFLWLLFQVSRIAAELPAPCLAWFADIRRGPGYMSEHVTDKSIHPVRCAFPQFMSKCICCHPCARNVQSMHGVLGERRVGNQM